MGRMSAIVARPYGTYWDHQTTPTDRLTCGDAGEAMLLFANAAGAGEGCAGVWPYLLRESGVVTSGQDDDIGVSEESLLIGLLLELLGGDGSRSAEAQIVRCDDLVQG